MIVSWLLRLLVSTCFGLVCMATLNMSLLPSHSVLHSIYVVHTLAGECTVTDSKQQYNVCFAIAVHAVCSQLLTLCTVHTHLYTPHSMSTYDRLMWEVWMLKFRATVR